MSKHKWPGVRRVMSPEGRKLFGYAGHVQFKRHAGDWRITYGLSQFLIAEGSGFSNRVGLQLFDRLTVPAVKRRRAR